MELIGDTWQPHSVKGSTPLVDASKIQLHQKKFLKSLKNPLTNLLKYAIIKTQKRKEV